MASRFAPILPPEGFIPVTPAKWQALCDVLDCDPDATELTLGRSRLGLRAARHLYVDPEGYQELVGRRPDEAPRL
ncbi:hypothetical protein [Lysobacter sp. N42]|uniref:hypothetical protein n=1 Tax=Lysobacter sp. N42 TaxID=2545719 RepID=UPI0010506E15|nr:hypothetical protein [Lysobacter sp. N42]TCZ85348.1 hypothetical protein EYQ95_19140 [Lysobacter sp. N42]